MLYSDVVSFEDHFLSQNIKEMASSASERKRPLTDDDASDGKMMRVMSPCPGDSQTRLTEKASSAVARADPFAFMDAARGLAMRTVTLPDAEYVPKFGSTIKREVYPTCSSFCDRFTFEPERNGRALLIRAGCGRGKSFAFREYMARVLKGMPGARVLLLSANILYGSNLAAELKHELSGVKVGFY